MRINTGDIEIQVREYQHDGDAVIFLHFGGGNMMMWQDVVPHFQDSFHVVLLDLRGHGKSDKPKMGYHIDEMAKDVIKVMEHLNLENAHVVGSSLGAEVGLSMAANYPNKILSLVCEGALFNEYGPYGLWEGSEEAFEEHARQRLEKMRTTPEEVYPSIDALVDESRKFFEERGWWNAIFESVVRYDAIKIGNGKYVKSWGRMAEAYTKHYLFYQLENYYRKVQCPILMLPDTYPGQDDREKEIMAGLSKLVESVNIVHVPEWVHPFGWTITPESGSKAVIEFFADIQK